MNDTDRPTIYRSLMDTHLERSREMALTVESSMRDRLGTLFRIYSESTAEAIQEAYAEGLRDGFSQGVAYAAEGGAS